MRDIKFRAWNKEKNIMCYEDEDNSAGYLDGWIASDIQVINQTLNSDYIKKRYDFMQYTGLHDKNGKEIYEGDIVRKFNGIIGKVIYEHSEFIIDVTNNKKLDYGRLDLIENFIEVIGNIYDNPDLLEKGAEE